MKKPSLKMALRCGLLAAVALPVAAFAQLTGNCSDLPGTVNVPAPGSGTITLENLTKFNLPAKACVNVGTPTSFNPLNLSAPVPVTFDYTTTVATRYNNAKFPASCAGVEYTLNGGPVYTAVTGSGNLSINLQSSQVTGSVTAKSFSQTENLTLSAGGNSFVINTGMLQMTTTVTMNADKSTDIKVCTPKGGVPATVGGNSFTIPTNVWQCLAQPTSTQANVRVTYAEGC